MKLYIYDHCPFCVRARLIAGLRGVVVEEVVLLNDDEDTPNRLIGAKQVPILEKPDGTHMGESLDIVRFIDEYAGQERLVETVRDEVQQWADKVNEYYGRLLMPRDIKLGLREFATQSAIDYFVAKKEKQIGSFAKHLDKTGVYLQQINSDLNELSALLPENAAYFNGSQVGMEDIVLFPMLRNLTMARGIEWPARLLDYVQQLSDLSGVDTYFDRAL